MLAVIMLPAVFFLEATLTQQALLVASVILVLIVELLDSAVESTVDRISLANHELAKRAKDTGSAAVLLSLLLCLTVWAMVILDIYG